MKRIALLVAFLILGICFAGYAYAGNEYYNGELYLDMPGFQVDRDNIPYGTSALNKLERGAVNMATFWMEIPAEVAKVSKEKDPGLGFTVGMANGIVTSAVRGLTGLMDTVTFFVPSYTKPAMKPEYAMHAADEKIKAWLW